MLKWSDKLKPFSEFNEEPSLKESDLLPSHVEENIERLSNFEVELGERRNETLFKITAEIENAENALKQAEQLAHRLKKRLKQLKDLQKVLSR
ncbi:MAG: hypothetical protein J7K94_04070 [Dehalococcoidia bacterium]|nr:hypothetical protein [Dehalococcoidia bacterium]